MSAEFPWEDEILDDDDASEDGDAAADSDSLADAWLTFDDDAVDADAPVGPAFHFEPDEPPATPAQPATTAQPAEPEGAAAEGTAADSPAREGSAGDSPAADSAASDSMAGERGAGGGGRAPVRRGEGGRPLVRKEYYAISEVSDLVGLPAHVLRYWESQFAVLNPTKNRSGNRAYQRKEIKLILLVKQLLHEEKYTVEGAKQKLEQLRRGGTLADATARALDQQMIEVLREEITALEGLLRLDAS